MGVFKQQFTRANGERGESKKYYGQYCDEGGKLRRVPLSTDKQVAQSKLADLVKQAERRKAGYFDKFDDAGKTPLAGLVEEFLDFLRLLKDDGDRHVSDVRRLLNTVTHDCKFACVGDLDGAVLERYLVRRRGRGNAARTLNTYRGAARSFGNWLVRTGRIRHNPLANVTLAVGDAKVRRRALPLGELRKLLEVAAMRPLWARQTIYNGPRKGQRVARLRPEVEARLRLEGRQRALLYRVAIYTGMRRDELRRTLVRFLDFANEGGARAALPGAITKNGRAAFLPLRADLAADLAAWIAETGRGPDDLLFAVGRDTAKHIKRDLKAAGIPVYDADGRVFDFHALRKCTATYMNKGGVPLTTAKELMRHSTVELTAGVYNDEGLHDYMAAVEALPTL